jgi:RimJ/RimL family protein N-acetyltransferase
MATRGTGCACDRAVRPAGDRGTVPGRGTSGAARHNGVVRFSLPERLIDGDVAVRPMRPEDAAAYSAAFREDSDLGGLLGIETDPEEASTRQRIEAQTQGTDERRFVQLAIADAMTDSFWGELIVHSLHDQHRRGEIGFWVVRAQRQRGVGSRAVALTLTWLFNELDLLRVEMTTTPENRVVPRLAQRLGFEQEGVLRLRNVERGQRVDIVWFGLLREEWERESPG